MSIGIVTKDPNITGSAHSPIHRSKVPLSYRLAGTYRFGEISPHFVAEVENNDKWPLRCVHNVRSFNLKAPLMGDIYYRKNYFQVPMEAILPLNWDKVYTNPTQGDDVDAKNVNCVVDDFPGHLRLFFSTFIALSNFTNFDASDDSTFEDAINALLKLYISGELFFSAGSLFATLGTHLSALLKSNFDQDFDKVFGFFNNLCSITPVRLDYKGDQFIISAERFIPEVDRNKYGGTQSTISFGHFMDLIRDDFDWSIIIPNPSDVSGVSLKAEIDRIVSTFTFATDVDGNYPEWPYNYKREAAYQLVCHHFFSNDKIDYIYSAELYRQLFFDSLKNVASVFGQTFPNDIFTYNGLDFRYDYLSGYNVTCVFYYGSLTSYLTNFDACNNVFRLLFGFNRSLRHLDYFSGAKSQPLGVGDTDVNVVANKVNAIDITRSIQKQRFLNFVHLVGRKFEEYTAKLNGSHVDFDWHNPISIAKGTSDVIYGSEVENNNINPEALGQPAQSTTGVLRGSANTTAFELDFDRPSVVLGVTWFDIERFYVNNIERQNFHVDRFDMFNEFMQYVGDQPIYRCELTPRDSKNVYFGYAFRHQEYKTRVNQCFGGFGSGMLPAWQFIADQNADDALRDHISPDYIRSRPSELDPFFLSLTGYSRGTYWHFIIENHNITDPIRPMVLTPQILG